MHVSPPPPPSRDFNSHTERETCTFMTYAENLLAPYHCARARALGFEFSARLSLISIHLDQEPRAAKNTKTLSVFSSVRRGSLEAFYSCDIN